MPATLVNETLKFIERKFCKKNMNAVIKYERMGRIS